MVIAFRVAGMNERHLVHMAGEMREEVAYPCAAAAVLGPLEGRGHEGADGIRKESCLAIEAGESLAVALLQFRFVIPCIDVAGSSVGEDPDDGFGAGGALGCARGHGIEGISHPRAGEHGLEGEPAESATGLLEKLAPAEGSVAGIHGGCGRAE